MEDFNNTINICTLKFTVYSTMQKTNAFQVQMECSLKETICGINFLYSDHNRIKLKISNNVTFRKTLNY